MAHHQHNQRDSTRRTSTMQSLLKMFNITNTTSLPFADEDENADVDEPPEDQVSPLEANFPRRTGTYSKTQAISANEHRRSLLTQAIMASSVDEHVSRHTSRMARGTSAASSHSTASMASTAELTSDGGLTSPPRSATPSPPLPPTKYTHLPIPKADLSQPGKVIIAPITRDDKPAVVDVGEAAVEKILGRKRCIGFSCAKLPEKSQETNGLNTQPVTTPELPKRKCMISFTCNTPAKFKEQVSQPVADASAPVEAPRRKCTISFACPMVDKVPVDVSAELTRNESASPKIRPESPALLHDSQTSSLLPPQEQPSTRVTDIKESKPNSPLSPISFHEFGEPQDEPDAWVDRPIEGREKLTLNDCMKKENAIRKIGKEAEEEAEEEEEEQEEDENEEVDENDPDDDFAPSDEDSDGGNESDDEDGFAQSDEDSDGESEDQFWAPSTTTAATSTENINISQNLSHFSSRQRSTTASSLESSTSLSRWVTGHDDGKSSSQRRAHKLARMRPGTPELPDSTDFVCGTLDEDRPLEAAYISCREQKKLEKRVPIPQDIDPSFPTTDPEDNDDDEDIDVDDTDDHLWFKDQLVGVDNEKLRGRRKSSTATAEAIRVPVPKQPATQATAAKLVALRSPPPKSKVHRSPPPKSRLARSPPPRRLFGHSPQQLRSPPAPMKLRSPRGSPTSRPYPVGITINRLAQRPAMGRTASLPHTPNPFFHNYKNRSPTVSTVTSGAVTPGDAGATPRPDMHIRGPVDIVIGLEKKRQKRKEKFWRQHCRKAAKEQAERKPVPGRGAERMKELGLECAERNRGYGLGQPAQLVISL